MIGFLRKLFANGQEVRKETVPADQLGQWFAQTISGADFGLKEYSTKLEHLKRELLNAVQTLAAAEIDEKKHKGVEGRIRNIVKGHRDNYCRVMGRFAEELKAPGEEIKDALACNDSLQQRLDKVAQQTAKSYQASQHLFFDRVEPVFNILGELNLLARNFKTEMIQRAVEVRELIQTLEGIETKKLELQAILGEKEEEQNAIAKQHNEANVNLAQLKGSDEYGGYCRLRKRYNELQQKQKDVDAGISSFFFRLERPLRKYSRIALDSAIIGPYLENAITAFWDDKELRILNKLRGLERNIDRLQLDGKQKKNSRDLVANSERDLKELQKRGKEVKNDLDTVEAELAASTINGEIANVEDHGKKYEKRLQVLKEEIEDLRSRIGNDGAGRVKQDIVSGVNETLGVELTID